MYPNFVTGGVGGLNLYDIKDPQRDGSRVSKKGVSRVRDRLLNSKKLPNRFILENLAIDTFQVRREKAILTRIQLFFACEKERFTRLIKFTIQKT